MTDNRPEHRASEPIELDIPEGIDDAQQSIEVLRAWISDGSLRVSLDASAFGDRTSDWGRLLGEIAHHMARAAALEGHADQYEALQDIREGIEAVLRTPQPTLEGKVRRGMSH